MTCNLDSPLNLFLKRFDSAGEAERLIPSPQRQDGGSWHPDGKKLAFVRRKPTVTGQDFDVWVWSKEGSPSARPFLETRFNEQYPTFSPDGRWLAYTSNDSGKEQVYIEPYPGPGRRRPVSTDGGRAPAWARRGTGLQLLYKEPVYRWMAVDIEVENNELQLGAPVFLFEGHYQGASPTRTWDVTPDGERFLMIQSDRGAFQASLDRYLTNRVSIVLNWFEELERLVPTDN